MYEKIVVFGSTGMLGSYVCKFLKLQKLKVEEKNRYNFDIAELFSQGKLMDKLQEVFSTPNILVINCAGITNKRAEKGIEELYIVNSIFPMMLDMFKATIIHISTDCVFSGKKGNYSIEDVPDAKDNYGLSKNFGERLRNTYVIRTSIIGEEESKRYVYNLLEWTRQQCGTTIKGYRNHLWNGVTCLELARLIYYNWILNEFRHPTTEVVQVTTEKDVSKYQLLQNINDVYDLNIEVKPTVTPKPCDRRLKGTLVTTKSIKDQLKEQKEFSLIDI